MKRARRIITIVCTFALPGLAADKPATPAAHPVRQQFVPEAISAKKSDSPEAVARVRQQVAILRSYVEVLSIERTGLDDGKTGWLITFRQTDQTFGGPRTSTKWLKLGSEGFVVAMSPERL